MMSKVRKACRICGKLFTPCADCEADKTIFRWRRFLCSLECAKSYFAKLEEARGPKEPPADTHGFTAESAASQHKASAGNAFNSVSLKNKIKNREREPID